jgi:hypothetical protein
MRVIIFEDLKWNKMMRIIVFEIIKEIKDENYNIWYYELKNKN